MNVSVKSYSTLLLSVVLQITSAIGHTASAGDWPHWRGASRNDVVEETSHWTGGNWAPQQSWKKNVGVGSTSPLVAAGRLYAMGYENGQDSILCLDAGTGDEIWRVSYPSREYGRHATGDQSLYSGVTSTPELDQQTGYLYTLSTDGELNCWDTQARGQKVWGLNLYDTFDVPQRPKVGRSGRRDYGYTSSPLLLGDWVIVEVGASAGNLVAFDKRSGQQRWASESHSPAGHTGGPVPMTVEGVPCIAVQTHDGLLVVRADRGQEGRTVAQWPWATDYANNIATTAVDGDCVLLTSAYNHHKLVKLQISLRGAKQVWEHGDASGICTPLIHKGHVYWAWRGVKCLDFETGQLKWRGGRVGDAGSCIATSDGRLLVWANRGDLSLVEMAEHSPDRYVELAKIDKLGRADAWPHGVLADGRFYGKDRKGWLVCLDLQASRSASPTTLGKNDATRRSATTGLEHSPNMPKSVESTPRGASTASSGEVTSELTPDAMPWQDRNGSVVFAWDRTFGPRIHGPGDKPSDWRFKARGSARGGPGGLINLTDGAAVVDGADDTLLSMFKDGNQFSLEVVFTAANDRQNGPARMVSFSTDAYSRNFTLGQEGKSLVLRLRTTSTGLNGQKPEVTLCPVTPGKRQHVIVSYREGRLVCYLDSKRVTTMTSVQGDFSNWSAQHLIFGDEWDDGRDWDGTIERVAIYRHAVGQGEVSQLTKVGNDADMETAASLPSDPDKQFLVHLQNLDIASDETAESATPGSSVRVELTTDAVDDSAGGVACYRIKTPAATYYLEKSGAGLSSLIDRDGNDWLSFHPRRGSGAGGEYRGFPNAVHQQEGSYFHAGNDGTNGAVTKVEYSGNDRVSISAASKRGHWACRYDFHPAHCTFTMTRMPSGCKYWVLYEGTPGGQYDDNDWWMTSQVADKQPLTKPHNDDIPAPEWICFGDHRSPRALVLVHHEDDLHPDRFYQMQRKMTVFGFGRSGLDKYLDHVPQHISVFLTDFATHAKIDRAVRGLLQQGSPVVRE